MDAKQISEAFDKVSTGIELIQKEHKILGDKFAKHEGLQKLVDDTSAALESIQKARQAEAGEKAALEETVKSLEKKILRGVGANDAGSVEEFKKYGDEFNGYLKKGYAIDSKTAEECVRGIIEKNFRGMSAEEISIQTKEMLVGNNPAGGYLVRPEVSSRMIKRIFETSPLRLVANVQTIGSDGMEVIIDDNEASSGGWVGETDARTATNTPLIGKLTIEAHEQYAMPKATQKFLDDAGIDAEAWLAGKTTDILSRTENTSFISGNGVLKPRGILTLDDATTWGTYERGKVQTMLTSTNDAIVGDDMVKLQNGIKEAYQARAVWLMKRATFGTVATLKASTSGVYILQSMMMKDRPMPLLLGKDIIFCDDMPAIADDALPVAYGDFNEGYTIVDRTGFRVIRDPYTAKPYVLFYVTKRTGGDVTSYESFARLRID